MSSSSTFTRRSFLSKGLTSVAQISAAYAGSHVIGTLFANLDGNLTAGAKICCECVRTTHIGGPFPVCNAATVTSHAWINPSSCTSSFCIPFPAPCGPSGGAEVISFGPVADSLCGH